MSFEVRSKELDNMTTAQLKIYVEDLKREKHKRDKESREALERIQALGEICDLEKELKIEVILAG